MKVLFIGSRLYDDIDWYVKSKNIESVLTESNEEAINLDLPDQVFIVPRGMDGPKQVALMQKVDAIVPLIGIDPPLIDVARMKEEVEEEYGIPVVAAGVRAVELTSNKIRKENPSHVIIVDACLMGCRPGDIRIVDKDDFTNIGISTHSMSLSYFVKYLERDTDFKIIFVGIEPETMDWGAKPTSKVEKSANEFIEILKGIIL